MKTPRPAVPRSLAVVTAALCRIAVLLLSIASLSQLAAAEGARTVVDDAGRAVTVPESVERILAAGPPAEVVLYTLAPEKLVGWVKAPSAEARAYLAAPYRDLPVSGRLTGKGNTVDADAIRALKPDLIVDIGDIDPGYVALADKVSRETGIPYVLLDGTLAKTGATYRTLGGITGDGAKAEALAAYADDTLSALRPAADAEDKRPRIYYGRGPDGLQTGLAGSLNTEFISTLGGTNVADSLGSGNLTTVTPEQIASWNPDMILTLDKAFAKRVSTDPAVANVAAVRDGRVFVAPALPFGWIDSPPGVNRLLGLRWASALMQPDTEPADLAAAARDFYRLFYHVELGPEQVQALLQDASVPGK